MIQQDKLEHFLAGATIAAFTIFIFSLFNWQSYLIGFAVGSCAGLLKEVYWDKMKAKGQNEWGDWGATALGALLMDLFLHWLTW